MANRPTAPRRSGTSNKNYFKTFFATSVAFGIPMMVPYFLTGRIVTGIIAGSIAGIAFGLFMTAFIAIMNKRMAGKIPLLQGEELYKEGPANLMRNGEGVGGWLTLTDQRLQFTPHKINIQTSPVEIPLHAIVSGKTVATAKIIPNGFQIITVSSEKLHFVVHGRAEWVDALARAKRLRN